MQASVFSPCHPLTLSPCQYSPAMPTQRYKLTLAYQGTRYHGWQKQPALATWKGEPPPEGEGIPTIQEKLAIALASVLHHRVFVVGSSRTDAGVHAKGQIAHFDTDQTQIPAEGLRQAVNSALPGRHSRAFDRGRARFVRCHQINRAEALSIFHLERG